MRICDACGIVNIHGVNHCDCGFDFRTAKVLGSPAGVWPRTKALWIDVMILVGPLEFSRKAWFHDLQSNAYQISSYIAIVVYFAAMESSPWKATLGKKLFGIQVTDLHGRRITFLRAFARSSLKIFPAVFILGYILALFTPRRQTLHDKIAGCLVITEAAGRKLD